MTEDKGALRWLRGTEPQGKAGGLFWLIWCVLEQIPTNKGGGGVFLKL